jgi:hypothetical protein
VVSDSSLHEVRLDEFLTELPVRTDVMVGAMNGGCVAVERWRLNICRVSRKRYTQPIDLSTESRRTL